ncbi:MAG: Hpt domain-containing protein, partial [Bdellovibrionales bacterium]|nr:Hpt domain-containing protein [Bdellovibrionales bacterium]
SAKLEPREIYRASASFHTLKGGAGFFGLTRFAEVSGSLESLLIDKDFNWDSEVNHLKELFSELKIEAEKLPKSAHIQSN